MLAKFSRTASHSGFSLAEVVLAMGLMTGAIVALANLFAISQRANQSSKKTTFAALLAEQKMEQLRGLTWGFDTIGLPLSDTATDTTVVPQVATGGMGLRPSPALTLLQNTANYVDYLDKYGVSLGGGSNPPTGTSYIRRWSVEPLPTNPNNTLILQVVVTPNRNANLRGIRKPDEARILSVKTRKMQ